MSFGMDGTLHFKVEIVSIEIVREKLKADVVYKGSKEAYTFKVKGRRSYTPGPFADYQAPFEISFYIETQIGERLIEAMMIESKLRQFQDCDFTIEKIVVDCGLNLDRDDNRTLRGIITGTARHSILSFEILPYSTDFDADVPFCTILRNILEDNIGYDFEIFLDK